MASTRCNIGLDRLDDCPLVPQQYDSLPSDVLPRLQYHASEMARVASSATRSGAVAPQAPMLASGLQQLSSPPLNMPSTTTASSYMPFVPAPPDANAWLATFQAGDGVIPLDAPADDPRSLDIATSSGTNAIPETISVPSSENQRPKAKKHWSNLHRRRVPHHVIERRYRDNLNGQIEALRTCIPSLTGDPCSPVSDLEDGPMPTKLPSKAVVIATAQTYIRELEEQQNRLHADARALREQVAGLQKLVRCDDCSVIKYFNSLQLDNAARAPPGSCGPVMGGAG